MVGEREKFVLLKNLSHLGKKGAFYRSPQKLAVGPCPNWRLRCKWAGDSGVGRRLRPNSGLPPDRAPEARHTLGHLDRLEISGLEGPETPVTFRCPSGQESSAAPQLGKEQRKI